MFPVDKPGGVDELWPADRLDDLLAESDVVVLALPLNEMTRGMFDAARLAKMKSGALLANMARGPLVVESALVEALRSEALVGAVSVRRKAWPLGGSAGASSKLNVSGARATGLCA